MRSSRRWCATSKNVGSKLAEATTWRQLVEAARAEGLEEHEARWILEEATGAAIPQLASLLESPPRGPARRHFEELVAARASGMPLQYAIGHWSFRSLDLSVDRRALIPRPETELLVERALAELSRIGGDPLAVDLGTGSGAIACSLVVENARLRVIATERSPEALALAAENRERLAKHCAERLTLRQGDWFAALDANDKGRISLVASNPPYVSEAEWAVLDPVVRDHEPRQALVAGPSGLEALGEILAAAPEWLDPTAAGVVIEIAPHQEQPAIACARAAGASMVEVVRDLAGRPRVLVARF